MRTTKMMRKVISNRYPAAFAAIIAFAMLCLAILPAGQAHAADAKKLSVVVVTGGHGFDEKIFPKTFEGQSDIDFKIIKDAEPFKDISKWSYDVIVLYNLNRKISETSRANFLKLLKRGVGLVVMHHAVAAYPGWVEYEKIIGLTYSLRKGLVRNGMKYMRPVWKHGVDFNVRIEDKSHPITKGMSDFKITDESYKGWVYHPGSHLLLSTNHKRNNYHLAWTRFYGKARVFFMQLGHGKEAFENKNYQHFMAQGIRWSAGRLPAGPGADSRKIVFLWSKGKHPNQESAKLLAGCLKTAINAPEIKAEVRENWPADLATLNDAAAVVICGASTDKKVIDALKAKGIGVVTLNASQPCPDAKPIDGCPDHPVSRGWKKFKLAGDANAGTAAWAIGQKSGGRTFAFSGGRSASDWKNEDCRRMMLNGILWSAKIQVPFDGIQTKLPK
ncbi:MAG: ThuA domain-containing protein [bacterium]|nr:ThuA domain-containing protein [bacterium]